MRAIVITQPGGPDVLAMREVPDATAGPGEVLVAVTAAGVNRADLMQRMGHYPPPPGAPEYPGLECSGTIAALGAGVAGWSVGDEVCGLLSGGGYAELVAVPAGQLLPVPRGVSLVEAAALPEVACTVWSNVFMTAVLQPGEMLLVHGGSSGIGTMAIQLAKAAGARVAAGRHTRPAPGPDPRAGALGRAALGRASGAPQPHRPGLPLPRLPGRGGRRRGAHRGLAGGVDEPGRQPPALAHGVLGGAGPAAARNMLEDNEPYGEIPWFWSDQYEHNLQYAGFHTEWDELVIRGSMEERNFVAFYRKDRRVLAAVAINRSRDLRRSIPLIKNQEEIAAAKLCDPDIDLRTLAGMQVTHR